MRGLRNRLSAIYQICRMSDNGNPFHAQTALSLIRGLAEGTVKPQEALADMRRRLQES